MKNSYKMYDVDRVPFVKSIMMRNTISNPQYTEK
jgi:hypothetical protein